MSINKRTERDLADMGVEVDCTKSPLDVEISVLGIRHQRTCTTAEAVQILHLNTRNPVEATKIYGKKFLLALEGMRAKIAADPRNYSLSPEAERPVDKISAATLEHSRAILSVRSSVPITDSVPVDSVESSWQPISFLDDGIQSLDPLSIQYRFDRGLVASKEIAIEYYLKKHDKLIKVTIRKILQESPIKSEELEARLQCLAKEEYKQLLDGYTDKNGSVLHFVQRKFFHRLLTSENAQDLFASLGFDVELFLAKEEHEERTIAWVKAQIPHPNCTKYNDAMQWIWDSMKCAHMDAAVAKAITIHKISNRDKDQAISGIHKEFFEKYRKEYIVFPEIISLEDIWAFIFDLVQEKLRQHGNTASVKMCK